MKNRVIEQTHSYSMSFNKQPHPTSPIREECNFTEDLSDRRGNEGEVDIKERRNEEEVALKKEKIKFIEYNRGYIDYAKQNRKKSTKVENIFWQIIKNRKILWYKFRRQKVIWPFILDFYCSELLLWIELDGWYHNDRIDYDSTRDSEIYKKWILVIRFRNEDIEKNITWVIIELEQIIKERREMNIDNS